MKTLTLIGLAACLLPIALAEPQDDEPLKDDQTLGSETRFFGRVCRLGLYVFCRRIDNFLDTTGQTILTAAGGDLANNPAAALVTVLNTACANTARMEANDDEEEMGFIGRGFGFSGLSGLSLFCERTENIWEDAAVPDADSTVQEVIAYVLRLACGGTRAEVHASALN